MGWGLSALLLAPLAASPGWGPVGPPGQTPEEAAAAAAHEPPPLSRRGERWRLAWLVSTTGFISGVGWIDNGLTLGLHLGPGVPVSSSPRVREEHGFGYSLQVLYGGWAGLGFRQRISAVGLVGRRAALFYQSSAGVLVYVHDDVPARPSLGGRLGVAIGRRANYILSFGGDLDIDPGAEGRSGVTAVASLSLLTVGAL